VAQGQEQDHVVLNVSGNEEIVLHMLPAVLSQPLSILRISQELLNGIGRTLDSV